MSDVYFEVEATDSRGRKRWQRTKAIWNSLNPIWNQAIEFESRDWRSFRVVLWDDDSDVPRRRARLSKFQTYSLTSYTPTVNETLWGYTGYASFSYTFKFECPCLNGGSCVHNNQTALCTCPKNFGGVLCEYPAGRLVVYVHQAENLPNMDDTRYNESDVFFEVEATDS